MVLKIGLIKREMSQNEPLSKDRTIVIEVEEGLTANETDGMECIRGIIS